ncbi:MAG: DUF1330 domain-containing protein [Sulfuricaulis sp.]|uniref:DUF1330 domain-containing protein n=1 Tax=Sulfuricaulis sp. TaxID=2003553 RepID=UPI0025F8E668|nr:DUF1330 domain-containing protein [Sulfuricaulis sp.]MCR4346068.1 DUF1330 domain-containing protein [Sulfuricaulis sp.]
MNERHILIVSLWVRNNDIPAFEAFERQAAQAMAEFGGRIERAIRMSGAEFESDKPFEIHIVSFPSEAAYQMYRQSSESRKLAEVRDSVISKAVILTGNEVKAYA